MFDIFYWVLAGLVLIGNLFTSPSTSDESIARSTCGTGVTSGGQVSGEGQPNYCQKKLSEPTGGSD